MASSAETSTPTNETTTGTTKTTTESTEIITLKISDEEIFEVEESPPADTVPLLNVLAKPFSQVIEFCKEHIRFNETQLKKSRKNSEVFLKEKSNEDLLDQISQAVADRIQNKSVEYVRKCFSHVQMVSLLYLEIEFQILE